MGTPLKFVNKGEPVTDMLQALRLLATEKIGEDYRRGFLEKVGSVYYIRRVHEEATCCAIRIADDIKALVEEKLALMIIGLGYLNPPRWFRKHCGHSLSAEGQKAYEAMFAQAAKILLDRELEEWEKKLTKWEGW